MIEQLKTHWQSAGSRIRAWYDRFRRDADQQYSCKLPGNPGSLSFFLLKLFFSGIRVNEHQIEVLKRLPRDATVIYVTKHKSHFEHLFYHIRYQQQELPFPELAFDYRMLLWQPVHRLTQILYFQLSHFFRNFRFSDAYDSGCLQKDIGSGASALFSLIDDRGFYRRFVKAKKDPVQCIIRAQRASAKPIYIVPQLFFFGKKPEGTRLTLVDFLFGSATKPGQLRRLITLFNRPDKINIEISEPIDLKALLSQPDIAAMDLDQQSLHLRRYLLDQINRHRQGITGPYLKSKQELRESILTSDPLQDFMKAYGQERELSIQRVHQRANSHLSNISAKYNPAVIKVLAAIVRWVIYTMFDGESMNDDGLNRIKIVSHKGPLIFIPCHKSHIDYLILSYVMYMNNMPCPHIAAGDNLSFWPLGTLFRRGGAFFIRRTFKGAALYTKVFNAYIHKLLEEGFNVEFFIEGGRSRTGKLILPKLGLLSSLLRAYREGACNDMIFVPIYVGYDRVLEERSYLNELEGGEKNPESLTQVIKASRFLRKRFGKIYINFHEPISLQDLLSSEGLTMKGLQGEAFDSFCRNLGFRVIRAIDRVSVVTPHGIVAAVILNSDTPRLSYSRLLSGVDVYMRHLNRQNAKLSDTLVHDRNRAIRQTVDDYIQNRCIEPIEPAADGEETAEDGTHYIIADSRRFILEYYKNNCVTFFLPAAYVALAIIVRESPEFSALEIAADYAFFQILFKNDFAFDVNMPPEEAVRGNLNIFLSENILAAHPTVPEMYSISAEGLIRLRVFAAFLKTYLESYWITIKCLQQEQNRAESSDDRLKRILQTGSQMYRDREITRKESLSKVTYKNAVRFFTGRIMNESDLPDPWDFYSREIQKYMNAC